MSDDSVFDLSPAEKLQLVEDLWDDLAATPSEVPIHGWALVPLEPDARRNPETSVGLLAGPPPLGRHRVTSGRNLEELGPPPQASRLAELATPTTRRSVRSPLELHQFGGLPTSAKPR